MCVRGRSALKQRTHEAAPLTSSIACWNSGPSSAAELPSSNDCLTTHATVRRTASTHGEAQGGQRNLHSSDQLFQPRVLSCHRRQRGHVIHHQKHRHAPGPLPTESHKMFGAFFVDFLIRGHAARPRTARKGTASSEDDSSSFSGEIGTLMDSADSVRVIRFQEGLGDGMFACAGCTRVCVAWPGHVVSRAMA